MGKASNRKNNRIGFACALSYNGLTVYRAMGVNPKYGPLVVKAIQSIYQDDVAGAKSHIEALERHGVSIFEFSVGFDNVANGSPQCACSWALSTNARKSLSWLIKKAFDKGDAPGLPFIQWVLYQIDTCATDSAEFSIFEFAATTFIACFVAGRPQEVLDTIPQDIGSRARAITINEAQKELARLTQIELNACIPASKPQDTGKQSAEKATVVGGRRL